MPLAAPAACTRLVVACAAVVATAAGVLLVWGPWVAPPAPLVAFDGTPISAAINDASAQLRVQRYQVFLAALALVGLAVLTAPRRPRAAASRLAAAGASRWFQRGWALILAAVIVGALGRWIAPGLASSTPMIMFAGFYAVAAPATLRFYVAAAALAVLALPTAARLAPRVPRRVWWLAITAYTLAVTLPGLLEPLLLVHMRPAILRTIEWHFDSVLGGSYTLVAGSTERHLGYSYPLSLAKALIERRVGFLSFAADVRLVQTLNVAFALGALWACHAWSRARPLIAVLTMLLVLPWIHNNHQNIFFPNQSGLRFLFFPIVIVMLRYSHRLPAPQVAVAWGAFAALAIVWNVETGVAIAAAIVVHLAARADGVSPWVLLPLGARFLAGAVVTVAAVGAAGVLALGLWPLAFNLPRRLVQRTATGYGYGYPLFLDPLAILVFGLALWAVLGLIAAKRAGVVSARQADRGAVGVLVLVWAAYYILQPHPWNIWSYLLPGGLLLGERLFAARAAGILRVTFVLAVTIVIPAAAAGTVQTWQALERGSALASIAELDAERVGRTVSGVMVTAGDARAIEARAAFLRTVPADTVVVTGNSYLLPKLSGRAELFPQRDPVYSFSTRDQFEDFVSMIRARGPSLLLVDDPATLEHDDPHREYFARLTAALADRYRPEGVRAGWSVWRRSSY